MINSDIKIISKSKKIKPISEKRLKKQLLKDFKQCIKNESLNISVVYSFEEPIVSFEFRRKS